MPEQNQQQTKLRNPSEMAGKDHGPQGVDKAPGEETSQDTDNVVYQTQKGQGSEDGDPNNEADQPIENE